MPACRAGLQPAMVEIKNAGMIRSFRRLIHFSVHVAMVVTGVLQSLWPVLPPMARAAII
jgi:hypothetical protein